MTERQREAIVGDFEHGPIECWSFLLSCSDKQEQILPCESISDLSLFRDSRALWRVTQISNIREKTNFLWILSIIRPHVYGDNESAETFLFKKAKTKNTTSPWQIQIGLLRKPTHSRVKKKKQFCLYSQTHYVEWSPVDLFYT